MSTPIGLRLEHARSLSGLSAAGLGRLAGLSHATVSMIEAGERKDPSSGVIGKVARVLGVSADWLISGIGDPPDEEAIRAAVAAAEAEARAQDGGASAPPEASA